MGGGRFTETELMPNLVVGDFGLGGGKAKIGKVKRKPNFEPGPNPDAGHAACYARYPHNEKKLSKTTYLPPQRRGGSPIAGAW